MPLTHPLVTPRLRLEPVTEELAALANQSAEALGRSLNAEVPHDWIRSGLPLVRQRQPPYRPWRAMRAMAVHRTDNIVIGDIRFERIMASDEPSFEIGYGIIPGYRRQGLATEAAGAVIDWLFAEEGAELLIAGCDRRNKASIQTLRGLGFWLDGSRNNAFWWRLTPSLRGQRLEIDGRA